MGGLRARPQIPATARWWIKALYNPRIKRRTKAVWRKLLLEGHQPLLISHVNTASRMQSNAAAGEAVLSEPVYAAAADQFPNAQSRELNLRGKEAPVAARVLRC